MKPSTKVGILIFLVLLADQALKISVKTQMEYGTEVKILGLDWALLHFVENNGMAFGWDLGGEYGKLALSLFRIAAVLFLIFFIRQLINEKIRFGVLASFGLILAGAIGNIIDSAFYGLIFSQSCHYCEVARLFPAEGGYAGFLHGKVVDMMYFPIWQGIYPSWVPFLGGKEYFFFKPVFNIADVSITVGVLNILIFQRDFFRYYQKDENATPSAIIPATLDNNNPDLPEVQDSNKQSNNPQ
ncbi:MAG: lipoprotein signal peptidase [Haliscomenobacter sp.]|uniref:lipoprotein signal peptidase n=1 Tax=Haliscomenobacter sp. TaxID=2717303 RepID=UPI0029BA4C73|nr:lipoprotein signal peptidase [Haliscomenobacter sp.]MDX2067314.1 lipoprotein signal peptidase [Haliscomenobacter sp.]